MIVIYTVLPVPKDSQWDEVLDWEKNRFGLFNHDNSYIKKPYETEITSEWSLHGIGQNPILDRIIEELRLFLSRVFDIKLCDNDSSSAIVINTCGGGLADDPESFTLDVTETIVRVTGCRAEGAAEGVIYLINTMGIASAPVLSREYGRIIWHNVKKRMGGPRITPANMHMIADLRNKLSPILTDEDECMELRRLGYNEVWIGSDELSYIAQSSVLPELQDRDSEIRINFVKNRVSAAHNIGMKAAIILQAWKSYPATHVVFTRYPDIMGAQKASYDNLASNQAGINYHTLCSEHPVTKQFIFETVSNYFRKTGADKLIVLVGGEHFQHCFMRPVNCERGHTNCQVCELLGAEKVVSNLVKLLSEAVRKIKPDGEVLFWPYSASWAWSKEYDQKSFIGMMTGSSCVNLLTETEKDVVIEKGGYTKHLWDYSIDRTYLTEKALAQISYCHNVGISVYLKNEPKNSIEMMHTLYLPCMDRHSERYSAISWSGATGVCNMGAFESRPHTITQLLAYFIWLEPNPMREKILQQLTLMLSVNNQTAALHLRQAWLYFSDAMGYFPLIPSYITGPGYAGPCHPLILYPGRRLADEFYSIDFTADSYTESHRPSLPLFVEQWPYEPEMLRDWDKSLFLSENAICEIIATRSVLGENRSTLFLIEWTTIKHLCLTIRTCRNVAYFYRNRDFIAKSLTSENEKKTKLYKEMLFIANNELSCAREDEECLLYNPWNDYRHQSDGPLFYRTLDILHKKIEYMQNLIENGLPEYAKENNINL